MRASTKRILSILLSGIFLIGVIVVATSLIKPALDGVLEKRAVLYSKQSLFQNQQQAVGQVQQLIQQFQGFAALQDTVNLAMPADENTTQVLNQLDAMARTAGVTLTTFEVTPKAFESSGQALARRIGTLEIAVVAEGAYDEVKTFLGFLETNVRVFNVREVFFVPLAGQLSLGNESYRMSVVADTYYQD